MAGKSDYLLLTQLLDDSWVVAIVSNDGHAQRRARTIQEEATIKQCVVVPITVAALAPKLVDMLRGYNDPHIDALLAGDAADEPVTKDLEASGEADSEQ